LEFLVPAVKHHQHGKQLVIVLNEKENLVFMFSVEKIKGKTQER